MGLRFSFGQWHTFVFFSFLTGFLRAGSAGAMVIEAYGDSLTAGFLVDTTLLPPEPIGEIKKTRRDLIQWKLTQKIPLLRPERKFAAAHAPERTWPMGIAHRFSRAGFAVEAVFNRGVTAAKARDLVGQIVAQTSAPETRAYFFMGHNDLCEAKDTPPFSQRQFILEYHLALARWDQSHRGATAYLIPLGDIPRVYATLQNTFWNVSRFGRPLSCREAWNKFFPLCRHFNRLHGEGRIEAVVGAHRREANQALKTLAAHWNKITRNQNRYFYMEGALDEAYFPHYFAEDCFHLSEAGQDAIADSIFRRS